MVKLSLVSYIFPWCFLIFDLDFILLLFKIKDDPVTTPDPLTSLKLLG